MKNLQPFVRIAIRVVGGFLVGRGWADESTVGLFYDPAVLAAVVLGINELWYLWARRKGGAT